jgi:hypothetical protein
MEHPCDENPEPQEVHAHLEIDPPQAWYYYISLNSHTLVILLQVNPISSDELEIVNEGCYKIESFLSLHGFQIPMLDIIIGCVVRFIDCFLIARQAT